MATKRKKRSKKVLKESQAEYFLKILAYFILGSIWVRFPLGQQEVGLPVGLFLGVLANTHEPFQVDRKIEIAVLLMAAFISFFLPLGLVIQL